MNFDVIVVGGGLVGASFALALKDSGLTLAVVEAHPPLLSDSGGWDSRIYAISPGSAALLENVGAWSELDMGRVAQIEEMRVFGDDTSAEIRFSAYDAGLCELAFIAENRELQRALWKGLRAAGHVQVFAPAACRALSFAEDAAEIEFEDGRNMRARLIVAADGADSWVRGQAGIEVDKQPYRQTAVVANFGTALPHGGVATQWFRRDGVLALLPLPGARVSMVWSTSTDYATALLELPPADFLAAVTGATYDCLGELSLITPLAAFPLRLQRPRQLVLPRLALAGDAAHNLHPLAGQGVNLGFRDAQVLARVLTDRGAQTDCGDYRLLRRYERARAEDIATMRLATDGLQKLFNNDNPLLARARNWGLRAANGRRYLKNLLVQHAVG